LAWVASEATNPWVAQDWGSKSIRVGLVMTMLAKVQMPSLISTMSIHRREELNVVERNACNCCCPTWKPTFHAMVAKMLWIASWVPMCSLPWTQCKRWIPIGSMGCVHTNQGLFTIEGWGNISRIWNVLQKSKEDNQKARKIGRTVSQTPTPGPKQDQI
jgi:hypothetical protein